MPLNTHDDDDDDDDDNDDDAGALNVHEDCTFRQLIINIERFSIM